MRLAEVNGNREEINRQLLEQLSKHIEKFGMELINVELQKIEPDKSVQHSMNGIIISEQEKIAARNQADAREIEADGRRRATIKEASAEADAKIIIAEAEAEALRLKSEAANKYFEGNARQFGILQATQEIFRDKTKFVVPQGQSVLNLLGLNEAT